MERIIDFYREKSLGRPPTKGVDTGPSCKEIFFFLEKLKKINSLLVSFLFRVTYFRFVASRVCVKSGLLIGRELFKGTNPVL